LGIGIGDRFAMLEHAYYSVISPEGCAAILWHDGAQAPRAADALKLTAKELLKLKLIDAIIPEPLGGAHRNIHDTIYNVEQFITKSLAQLKRIPIDKLVNNRYTRIRNIGAACVPASEFATKEKVHTAIPDRLSLKTQLEAAKKSPHVPETTSSK
jgi:acetyl-CoA carboxylase carboxyl transferase subunit alpha